MSQPSNVTRLNELETVFVDMYIAIGSIAETITVECEAVDILKDALSRIDDYYEENFTPEGDRK